MGKTQSWILNSPQLECFINIDSVFQIVFKPFFFGIPILIFQNPMLIIERIIKWEDDNTYYQIQNLMEQYENDQPCPYRTNCMKNFPKSLGMHKNEKS